MPFVNRADSAQLFFPPFTPHLPQLAIPPVRTKHTGKRARNKFVWDRVTAVLLRRSCSKAGGITSRRMASAATLSHDRWISSGVTSSSVNSSPQAASRHMLMCAATGVDKRLTCSLFISGRTSKPSSPSWLAIKRNDAETGWYARAPGVQDTA